MSQSPAFVVLEGHLKHNLSILSAARISPNVNILYSTKALNSPNAIKVIGEYVDGFSVSSVMESQLSLESSDSAGTIHMVAPVYKEDDFEYINSACDYVTFNSISQWKRFNHLLTDRINCGLRVNPKVSFVSDDRYDPCRRHSKLGCSFEEVRSLFGTDPNSAQHISGLHVHSNCDSEDFGQLFQTVQAMDKEIPDILHSIEWINLGGGYLFEENSDLVPFREAIDLLTSKYGLNIFIEPGASIVRSACLIISTVMDIVLSDGMEVAVLDTTINHMPEVFEYQFEPTIQESSDTGEHEYILAGCSCLAGDIFGKYSFNAPLTVGSKVTFLDMGAYSLSRANTFNGIPLPTIYTLQTNGSLIEQKTLSGEDSHLVMG